MAVKKSSKRSGASSSRSKTAASKLLGNVATSGSVGGASVSGKPASRKTGRKVSKLAARAIKQPGAVTDDEVQELAASALSQTEAEAEVEVETEVESEGGDPPPPDIASVFAQDEADAQQDDALTHAVALEAAAPPDADAKFRRELYEMVSLGEVVFRFESEDEAVRHEMISRSALGRNHNHYRVSRDGMRLTVKPG